jgi:dolichyl-phosphate-mannose--protein O-mannosyl transferase
VPTRRFAAYDREVTSGVLIDLDEKEPAGPARRVRPEPPESADETGPVADVTRRRLARPPRPDRWFWFSALLVTFLGGALRLVNLAHPPDKIFDELYYADEANDLLHHGVEWLPDENAPQYVVHPPLGKWLIALGEWGFGYNSFGWRISAMVVGTLSILLVIVVAQRLFRSTVLACAAGLLMTLDGMHFVLSRTALLDIFLMFFIFAAFACLVFDREQRRATWLAAMENGVDPSAPGKAGRPRLGVPWWRLGAAVCVGAACGVKWSGIYYVVGFAVLVVVWEIGTRRSAGARHPIRDTFLDESFWMLAYVGLAMLTYLATWSGWFLSDNGYFRHFYADTYHKPEAPIIGALGNLWHYHQEAFRFHVTLTSPHQYQSWPWQWLLLGRPVAFYWSPNGPCGGPSCASEILLLGTPVLWWSFLPALVALGWLGLGRRDWRAGAIGLGVVFGLVPWFQYELANRTMFYFYALPAEPFLVLAVVYVLGAIIGPPAYLRPFSDQRMVGAIVAGAYMLVVAACFAYFYPIYAGSNITYVDWFARMWLGSRWI